MDQIVSDTVKHKNISKEEFNERDFAYIFEIYYKRVYNFIYYRVNDSYTAEDLTSQTFERYMLKIDTYNGVKSTFEAWLFTIAKNIVNDHFRSLKGVKILPIDAIKDLISGKRGPEDLAVNSENKDELLRAIKVLNPNEKEIIALKFAAGIGNKDIAAILNMSDSNVGVILCRAMKKLKKEIGKGEKSYGKK